MGQPFFSIIIPAYNRLAGLKKCLEALGRMTYPGDRFEVIVVDDGSTVPLAAVVEAFKRRFPVRYIRQENSGPATARNRGLDAARGDFVVFTDDDCRPVPDWLNAFSKKLLSHPGCAAAGKPVNTLGDNLFSATSQILVDYLFTYYNRDSESVQLGTSNNLAFPADRLKRVGGFDTRFSRAAAEDREICMRWIDQGLAMVFAPDAVVHHRHPLDLPGFFRQHFNYGCGAYLFHRYRSPSGAFSIKPEPVRFYLDLIRFPKRSGDSYRTGTIRLLLLLSQIANALGFFAEMRRAKTWSKLPPVL